MHRQGTVRITGTRHLARNGVEQALIMLLAGWAIAVILAYLIESPLEILTNRYRKNVGTSSASSSLMAAPATSRNNDKALMNLQAMVEKFDAKVM